MKKTGTLFKKMLGLFFLVAVLTLGGETISATEITPGDGGEEINYSVETVKEKIKMLPSETRMISSSISSTASFTSSDRNIVTITNKGMLTAQKPGTAKITQIDGTQKTIYTVQVNDTVDLIIFAGQSNMNGSGGSYLSAPTPDTGTAYEFDIATNTKRCLAMKEPFGEGIDRANVLLGKDNASIRGTLASAFCINYYKKAKTTVVGVPCFWGGSSTNTWLNRGLVRQTQKNINLAKKTLKKNKIKVRHIYMVWYQGESDAEQGVSQSKYISNMRKIYNKMKAVGVEQMFVINIGREINHPDRSDTVIAAQKKLCSKYSGFTMVSKSAPKLYQSRNSYYTDTIHLNQKGLNKIGYEAGKAAGNYAKKHSKKK